MQKQRSYSQPTHENNIKIIQFLRIKAHRERERVIYAEPCAISSEKVKNILMLYLPVNKLLINILCLMAVFLKAGRYHV